MGGTSRCCVVFPKARHAVQHAVYEASGYWTVYQDPDAVPVLCVQSSDRLPMENQGIISVLLLTAWTAVRFLTCQADPSAHLQHSKPSSNHMLHRDPGHVHALIRVRSSVCGMRLKLRTLAVLHLCRLRMPSETMTCKARTTMPGASWSQCRQQCDAQPSHGYATS